jgi:transcriptional regulator with XRE-family HTH domain
MSDAGLGMALTVLRIVRGWSQEELAKASGIRSGSISDYERNRMMPGLKTLQRLMGAMGYPLALLDHTQKFIDAVRADSPLPLPAGSAETSRAVGALPVSEGPFASQALQWEVEQVSAEAGRVVARLTRLLFVLMKPPATIQDSTEL